MGDRSVPSLRSAVVSCVVAVGLMAPLLATSPAGAAPRCSTPPKPMSFAPKTIIDENRAGGEPSIQSLADGSLLYASHAGTTHFYTPAGTQPKTSAFFANYEGQTYVWRSTDDGETWTFVKRTVPANVPASGFSDPDFAVDSAGNVYYSEINLVNIAVSSSSDNGKSFTLQNFFGEVLTDRQWSEADEEGVLYITGNSSGGGTFPTKPVGNSGHMMYKSVDGGKTFTAGQAIRGGLGDIKVDKSDGTVYEASLQGDTLWMSILRGARAGDLSPIQMPIAGGVRMLGHWPAIDIDDEGNLYITWDESGRGSRPAGIYYSYSTNRGMSWAEPVRVDADGRTDTWPWIAVGDPGRVGIAWLQADEPLPNHNAQSSGTHGWRIAAAQTLTGLGCDSGLAPSFTPTMMTSEPVHRGTICQGGTACQAQAIDRRLGDYFTIDVDTDGMLVAAYSDTSRGGAVSLPGFSRQSGGPSFLASGDDDAGPRVLGRRQGRVLPRTGLGEGWVALLATMLVVGALATRRWSARGA